ncbi:MAG: hypothetical protein P8141_08150 [Gammaproteobacteria bacterium]|jgi:hypothetical protein
MIYFYSFNSFDPKTGRMPILYGEQFEYFARRARHILRRRSRKEIQCGLNTINRMYKRWEQAFFAGQVKEAGKDDITVCLTPTLVLERQIRKYHIKGRKDFENAGWEEYFAILALALIGNAKNSEEIKYPYLNLTQKEIDESDEEAISNCLIDAMEAVRYAEYIIARKRLVGAKPNENNTEDELNNRLSGRNRNGTKIRRAAKKEMVMKVVDVYKKGAI